MLDDFKVLAFFGDRDEELIEIPGNRLDAFATTSILLQALEDRMCRIAVDHDLLEHREVDGIGGDVVVEQLVVVHGLLAELGGRKGKNREAFVAELLLELAHLSEVLLGVATLRGRVDDEGALQRLDDLVEGRQLRFASLEQLLDGNVESVFFGEVLVPCGLVLLRFRLLALGAGRGL